jgi:hypothetical protein
VLDTGTGVVTVSNSIIAANIGAAGGVDFYGNRLRSGALTAALMARRRSLGSRARPPIKCLSF